jgi:hypothetical protein
VNPTRRALLAALFLLALTGSVLHLAAHPIFAPDKAHPGVTIFRGSFVAASLLPLLDLVVVTWLFSSRRTAAYGYLLNGLIVVYGTVLMGHFGIAALTVLATKPATPVEWLFKSMLIDIVIVWADFFAGKALYESWLHEPGAEGGSAVPATV